MSSFIKQRLGKRPSTQPLSGNLPPRLNTLDLTALFRRLDINGDGELTFQEFRSIVSRLKLKTYNENIDDYIQEIFEQSDHDKSDGQSLDLQEFIVAYSLLYNRLRTDSSMAISGKTKGTDLNTVRATRYGYSSVAATNSTFGVSGVDAESGTVAKEERNYIFETYSGTINSITTKITYDLFSKPGSEDGDDNEDRSSNNTPSTIPNIEDIAVLEIELESGFNLETLNRLILADGERNKSTSSNILWWVDICTKRSRQSEEEAFQKAFGIPDEAKKQLTYLERDSRRLCFGEGEIVASQYDIKDMVGHAGVLSIFVEALRCKNVPMIRRDYDALEPLGYCGRYLSRRLRHYWPNNYQTSCYEFSKLSQLTQSNCDELRENNCAFRVSSIKCTVQKIEEGPCVNNTSSFKTIHSTQLPAPRLPDYFSNKSNLNEQYLLVAADINRRVPEITSDILSIHLQDQGYGPYALFTYRKRNSDLGDGSSVDERYSFEQHSRAGVLGRITIGVWKRLLEVCVHQGVLPSGGGELGDSTFALAILLSSMVHTVSIETSETIQAWHKHLSKSIEVVAVTKHSKHLEMMDMLLDGTSKYIQTFERDFLPVVDVFENQGGATQLHKVDEAARLELRKQMESESIQENASDDTRTSKNSRSRSQTLSELNAPIFTRVTAATTNSSSSSSSTSKPAFAESRRSSTATENNRRQPDEDHQQRDGGGVGDTVVDDIAALVSVGAVVPVSGVVGEQEAKTDVISRSSKIPFSAVTTFTKSTVDAASGIGSVEDVDVSVPMDKKEENDYDDYNELRERHLVGDIGGSEDGRNGNKPSRPLFAAAAGSIRDAAASTSQRGDTGSLNLGMITDAEISIEAAAMHEYLLKSTQSTGGGGGQFMLPLLKDMMHDAHGIETLLKIQTRMRRASIDRQVDAPPVLSPFSMRSSANIFQATKELKSVNQYGSDIYICTNFRSAEPWQQLELLKCFASHNSVSYLPQLIVGNNKVGFNGTKYWKYRLSTVRTKYERTLARYKVTLDEKRNYWAFVMSGVAIVTFPFAVMTGYFGMNFENMAAPGGVLTDTYWPMFPGDKVIWVLTIIVYGSMIVLSLHFEIFYGAS